MRAAWTKEQEEFLKTNYPIYGGKYCAQLLSLNLRQINTKAQRLALKIAIYIDTKTCTKCHTPKPLLEFSNDKKGKLGLSAWCKLCRYSNNSKNYYYNHLRTRQIENLRAKRDYLRDKQNGHPRVLINRLRHRIWFAVRGMGKEASTIKLLGCNQEQLAQYIQSKFQPGMTWQDLINGKIHLDHIKPCAAFDLSQPDQQKICFHYTNLQPLWAQDNLKKGAKWLSTAQ